MKKYLAIILSLIMILGLCACSNSATKNSNKNSANNTDSEIEDVDFVSISSSKDENNISFKFERKSTNTLNVINISEEGIAKDFNLNKNLLYNDTFTLDTYKPMEAEFTLTNFKNKMHLRFYNDSKWETGHDSNCQIIEQDENIMLMHCRHMKDYEKYYVYITYSEDGYFCITDYEDLDYSLKTNPSLETAKEIYEYAKEHIKVANVPFVEDENGIKHITSDKGICNGEEIDISNWNYCDDILTRNLIKAGFNINSSWEFLGLYYNNYYSIMYNVETGESGYGRDKLTFTFEPNLSSVKFDELKEDDIKGIYETDKITAKITGYYNDIRTTVKNQEGSEFRMTIGSKIVSNNMDDEFKEELKDLIIKYLE